MKQSDSGATAIVEAREKKTKESAAMASTTAPTTPKGYDEHSIQVLEGMEHVRARPAMYIGDIYERGLHHLVSEVVDNSVDEALAGHCKRIDVTIHADGAITVLDDGRGIPVAIHPKAGKPTVEVCLTVLGAGGKFDKDSYKVSGGLHGVGVSCVNALSEWLECDVYRDGKEYRIRFCRGQTIKPLEVVGPSERRGTKVTFKPDAEIFRQTQEFKFATLSKRLKELAYLNAGLKITLRDERGEGVLEEYCFENGLLDFVNQLSTSENVLLAKPIYFSGKVESTESKGTVECEIAIQYNDTYSDSIVSYANNIATIEGGTHETGFRTALTATLNGWLKDKPNIAKEDERPSGDDYREGLVAVISVKIPEPQFEGQTKTKLGNSDVAGIVQTVVGEYLKAWVEHHPAETKKIVDKAILAREARLAAKKAKDLTRKKKSALGGGGIAKLVHANSDNPEERELYLVEGDSAGGTAVQARNTDTQAILPLRGKILNVWKSTHEKMLSHSEIATMIQALGTGILDEFDVRKCEYGKVVIMCDADVDGSHIRTLILTFFFRQMPDLIKAGKVYVAQPPLYKVSQKRRRKAKASATGADATELADDANAEVEADEKEEREEKAVKGKDKKAPRERYITNEGEFESYMLDEGTKNAFVVVTEGTKTVRIGGGDLVKLLSLTAEFARLQREVERQTNRPFRAYLSQGKSGAFPLARAENKKDGKKTALYTDEEYETFLRSVRDAGKKVWLYTDPLAEQAGADFWILRIGSKARIEQIVKELQKLGVSWPTLFAQEKSADGKTVGATTHSLKLEREGGELPMGGLMELKETVITGAEKFGGVAIQRYKGLGEMDKDELEETTMKPGKRQLLKVTMEDMAQATYLFNVLMGTKVEPRRDYIEKYALDAKNLDV